MAVPIDFVYGVAPEGGKDQLIRHLIEVCKLSHENLKVRVVNELLVRDRPLSGEKPIVEKAGELKQFLVDVGTVLLLPESPNDVIRAQAQALGYSGTEGLVAFPYNVPSMTITALWCSGIYDNRPWVPILKRRRSLKNAIIHKS